MLINNETPKMPTKDLFGLLTKYFFYNNTLLIIVLEYIFYIREYRSVIFIWGWFVKFCGLIKNISLGRYGSWDSICEAVWRDRNLIFPSIILYFFILSNDVYTFPKRFLSLSLQRTSQMVCPKIRIHFSYSFLQKLFQV